MEFRTKVKVSRINNVWRHKLHYSDLDMSRYCGFDVSNHQLGSRKFAAKSSVKSLCLLQDGLQPAAALNDLFAPARTIDQAFTNVTGGRRQNLHLSTLLKRGDPSLPAPPPLPYVNKSTTYALLTNWSWVQHTARGQNPAHQAFLPGPRKLADF